MRLQSHAALSAVLGGGLYAAGCPRTTVIAFFLSGVFIDLDHVPDYLLLSGERPSLRGFFKWHYTVKWTKLYLFLHSYELVLAVSVYAFFSGSALWSGLAAGAACHLLADQISNRHLPEGYSLKRGFYFFIFRYRVGFRKKKMLFRT